MEIQGIGTIAFAKSKKARKLSISVRPFRGVRVAVPLGVSFARAKRFVESKMLWIRKNFLRIKAWENEHRERVAARPDINKSKARKKLVGRLQELAKEHNIQYNRVFIRNQRTRWGSCSVQNNINLNINLVRLPDKLMDYIIIHELLHVRIKNHSKYFWIEMNKLVGDAKALGKEVKAYSLMGVRPAA